MKQKSLGKIIGNIALTILFLLSITILVFSLILKNNNKTINFFGNEVRLVLSNSMAKCDSFDDSSYEIKSFNAGDAVIISKSPEKNAEDYYKKINSWIKENAHVGDVMTFSYKITNTQVEVITHRVSSISVYEDGYLICLQGDNRNSEDFIGTQKIFTNSNDTNYFNYLIGKVTKVSPSLGGFIRFVNSPITIIFLVIIPSAGIIIYEITHLILYLKKDKKERIESAEKDKDKEIEDLRKQIEALKKEGKK